MGRTGSANDGSRVNIELFEVGRTSAATVPANSVGSVTFLIEETLAADQFLYN